ncbi:hypothetical protein Taro_004338 [Colocasia esculenta]|uniref:Uncharacterized protein n=1 Tax=Colocasia esculenta TaxID=4460 RepID=A0A843TRC7_COLES|nr:hypothetical protein [Colocasia esculenta]
MPLTLSQRPETAAKFLWTEHSISHFFKRTLRSSSSHERDPACNDMGNSWASTIAASSGHLGSGSVMRFSWIHMSNNSLVCSLVGVSPLPPAFPRAAEKSTYDWYHTQEVWRLHHWGEIVGPSPLPLHQKLELVVKAVAKSLRRKRKAPRQRCGRHEGLRTGFYPCGGLGCQPRCHYATP